jgi:hypothetical protein
LSWTWYLVRLEQTVRIVAKLGQRGGQ